MDDSTGVLVVFTAKSVNQMLDLGGSQSWVLNEKSMRGVEYVVCTRNADRQYEEECGVRPEQHNSAFLVGRVSGLKKVERRHDRDRFLVEFSDYALVEVPSFRDGSTRNPVIYSDIGQCRENGLDISSLKFSPMPGRDGSYEATASTSAKKGLSIAEAKEGLSIFFGVDPENIQITING